MQKRLKTFRGSNRKIYTGEELRKGLNEVANKHRQIARNIRKEDPYASHITETQKNKNLKNDLEFADSIERGEEYGVYVRQLLNVILVGECPPLIP